MLQFSLTGLLVPTSQGNPAGDGEVAAPETAALSVEFAALVDNLPAEPGPLPSAEGPQPPAIDLTAVFDPIGTGATEGSDSPRSDRPELESGAYGLGDLSLPGDASVTGQQAAPPPHLMVAQAVAIPGPLTLGWQPFPAAIATDTATRGQMPALGDEGPRGNPAWPSRPAAPRQNTPMTGPPFPQPVEIALPGPNRIETPAGAEDAAPQPSAPAWPVLVRGPLPFAPGSAMAAAALAGVRPPSDMAPRQAWPGPTWPAASDPGWSPMPMAQPRAPAAQPSQAGQGNRGGREMANAVEARPDPFLLSNGGEQLVRRLAWPSPADPPHPAELQPQIRPQADPRAQVSRAAASVDLLVETSQLAASMAEAGGAIGEIAPDTGARPRGDPTLVAARPRLPDTESAEAGPVGQSSRPSRPALGADGFASAVTVRWQDGAEAQPDDRALPLRILHAQAGATDPAPARSARPEPVAAGSERDLRRASNQPDGMNDPATSIPPRSQAHESAAGTLAQQAPMAFRHGLPIERTPASAGAPVPTHVPAPPISRFRVIAPAALDPHVQSGNAAPQSAPVSPENGSATLRQASGWTAMTPVLPLLHGSSLPGIAPTDPEIATSTSLGNLPDGPDAPLASASVPGWLPLPGATRQDHDEQPEGGRGSLRGTTFPARALAAFAANPAEPSALERAVLVMGEDEPAGPPPAPTPAPTSARDVGPVDSPRGPQAPRTDWRHEEPAPAAPNQAQPQFTAGPEILRASTAQGGHWPHDTVVAPRSDLPPASYGQRPVQAGHEPAARPSMTAPGRKPEAPTHGPITFATLPKRGSAGRESDLPIQFEPARIDGAGPAALPTAALARPPDGPVRHRQFSSAVGGQAGPSAPTAGDRPPSPRADGSLRDARDAGRTPPGSAEVASYRSPGQVEESAMIASSGSTPGLAGTEAAGMTGAQAPRPVEALPSPGAASGQPVPRDPAPLMPRHLATDLIEGVRRAERDERVELLLDPLELGRVRFEIVPEGDRLQVVIQVERQETLDLLRRNQELLRAEFREAGFGSADLTFGQWGGGGEARPNLPGSSAESAFALNADEGDPPPRTPVPRLPGGLDLRL